MSKEKIPDNVVFDSESDSYNAALKPYGTNVGAPSITSGDTIAWKNRNIHKVNKQFETQFLELKAAHNRMMKEFQYNNLVYNAKFNFEPLIGETYYLYRDKKAVSFLSVIAPHECNFDYVGSFYLNSNRLWKRKSLKDE